MLLIIISIELPLNLKELFLSDNLRYEKKKTRQRKEGKKKTRKGEKKQKTTEKEENQKQEKM